MRDFREQKPLLVVFFTWFSTIGASCSEQKMWSWREIAGLVVGLCPPPSPLFSAPSAKSWEDVPVVHVVGFFPLHLGLNVQRVQNCPGPSAYSLILSLELKKDDFHIIPALTTLIWCGFHSFSCKSNHLMDGNVYPPQISTFLPSPPPS